MFPLPKSTEVVSYIQVEVLRVASGTSEVKTKREVGGKSGISSTVRAGVDVHGQSPKISCGLVVLSSGNGSDEEDKVTLWI